MRGEYREPIMTTQYRERRPLTSPYLPSPIAFLTLSSTHLSTLPFLLFLPFITNPPFNLIHLSPLSSLFSPHPLLPLIHLSTHLSLFLHLHCQRDISSLPDSTFSPHSLFLSHCLYLLHFPSERHLIVLFPLSLSLYLLLFPSFYP